MASSINASTTAGVVTTADTSGTLNIQTAGVTAISIDASQAVSFTNAPTVTGGTANGVAYLNGSKALTTGSALVFDGSNLGIGTTSPNNKLQANGSIVDNASGGYSQFTPTGFGALVGGYGANNTANIWLSGGAGNNGNQVGHYINSVMSGNGGGGGTASLQIGQLAWSGSAFTSGTAQINLDASGNLLVGTTTSAGAMSNAANVLGGLFKTASGSVTPASGVVTAVATLPSANCGTFIVSAGLPTGLPDTYNAVALIKTSGSASTQINLTTATSFTISMSGLSVRITQNSGGTNYCEWTIIRIS